MTEDERWGRFMARWCGQGIVLGLLLLGATIIALLAVLVML